jgi:hypothetical protein
VVWKDQVGTAGNDKGASIARDETGFVVAGFTDGALQTAVHGKAYVSGLTADDTADQKAIGNGDVFRATFG